MLDPKEISLCLITKDPVYPPEIILEVTTYKFGEILILTNCDSPHRKHELFAKTKYDTIAYQDDDAICPWLDLLKYSDPTKINIAFKPQHFEAYKDRRLAVGFGWGAIFPKHLLQSLKRYTDVYGEDEVYKRETERILTYLNWPQNRMVLPITDLPSATAPDRLSMQPKHYDYIPIVEEKCRVL